MERKFSEMQLFWHGGAGTVLYLKHSSHLSIYDHIRVNVCVYQAVQKSVAEKIK